MFYLRTGANGSFKTALTLWDVRQMQLKEGRPVCFVKDRFKANAILTEEFGWVPIELKDWQQHPKAIILADELHRDLPKIPETAKRAEWIEMLAEHRSYGIDFFLLDQHPLNIDPFVRRLIGPPGYHQHFVRLMGAANSVSVLQFDAVDTTCEKPSAVKRAQTSTRSPEKEAFAWYESAQLHTGKVRIPKQIWTLVVCVVALLVVGYLLYVRFVAPKTESAKTEASAQTASSGASSGSSSNGYSSSGNDRKPMTTAEYVAAYQPRLPGLMHTAPAYDKLTEPRRVPVPAACVEMKSVGCKCYTQDATPYPVDLAMCRQLVANGSFFAFLPEGEQRVAQVQPEKPRQAAETPLPALPGAVLIDGSMRPQNAPTAVSGIPPDNGSQPRVPPGSKWSFTTGGE